MHSYKAKLILIFLLYHERKVLHEGIRKLYNNVIILTITQALPEPDNEAQYTQFSLTSVQQDPLYLRLQSSPLLD